MRRSLKISVDSVYPVFESRRSLDHSIGLGHPTQTAKWALGHRTSNADALLALPVDFGAIPVPWRYGFTESPRGSPAAASTLGHTHNLLRKLSVIVFATTTTTTTTTTPIYYYYYYNMAPAHSKPSGNASKRLQALQGQQPVEESHPSGQDACQGIQGSKDGTQPSIMAHFAPTADGCQVRLRSSIGRPQDDDSGLDTDKAMTDAIEKGKAMATGTATTTGSTGSTTDTAMDTTTYGHGRRCDGTGYGYDWHSTTASADGPNDWTTTATATGHD